MTIRHAMRGLVSMFVLFTVGKVAIDLQARRLADESRKVSTSPVPDLEQYLSEYFSCAETWSANAQRCVDDTLISAFNRDHGVLVAAPESTVGSYRVRLRCGPSVGRDTMVFEYASTRIKDSNVQWSRLFTARWDDCG